MNRVFEAKYINITWQDKDRALKIVESDQALEIIEASPIAFEIDVVSYSKIEGGKQGQLAFRMLNDETVTPYFKRASGKDLPLKSFKDNVSGKTWWVEGDNWDKISKRWQSNIYRSAGAATVQLGSVSCDVHISASTFTYEDLNQYLIDFRHDLWELILNDSSYIKGAGKLTGVDSVDKDSVNVIHDYISYVDEVLKNPKVELRELQKKLPRKKVKPVPRTFMELSSKGDTRFLTSRASIESLNVAENRYVLYTLERVYLIVRAISSVSNIYAQRLLRNIVKNESRLDGYKDTKHINEESVRLDYEEKLEHFTNLNNNLATSVPDSIWSNGQHEWTVIFKINKKSEWLPGETFFASLKQDGQDWFQPSDNAYVTLTIPIGLVLEAGWEYRIQGDIPFEKIQRKKLQFSYTIQSLVSIEIVGGYKYENMNIRLQKIREGIAELEANKWVRSLSSPELEQQNKEKITIEKTLSLFSSQQNGMEKLAADLQPKVLQLKKQIAEFKQRGVRSNSTFPNSITFVHNPHYQGVHSKFKSIKALSGVDDDSILLALDRIDDIGLVHISLLYERWCLLQIIKVLLNSYHFKAEKDWKKKLIQQVLDQGENISLQFTNEKTGRVIDLWYEKVLDSGKIPDFILDVQTQNYITGDTAKKRFVLDAKFYQTINNKRHGGIANVIKELYQHKDYSEGGSNAVFILHPSKHAVPKRKTPQDWGGRSYYGEVPMLDWDNEIRPEHSQEYGAIYLSPVGQVDYLDELQRLIGMFLQYGVENNSLDDAALKTIPDGKLFCIACGSHEYEYSQGKNKDVWWITCKNCKHFSVYNYCATPSCRNRLIKNGEYWTYHSMEPMQPLNIKCPSCLGVL